MLLKTTFKNTVTQFSHSQKLPKGRFRTPVRSLGNLTFATNLERNTKKRERISKNRKATLGKSPILRTNLATFYLCHKRRIIFFCSYYVFIFYQFNYSISCVSTNWWWFVFHFGEFMSLLFIRGIVYSDLVNLNYTYIFNRQKIWLKTLRNMHFGLTTMLAYIKWNVKFWVKSKLFHWLSQLMDTYTLIEWA